MLNKFSEVYLV